jgi:UDP-N-acetylglucosamine 2-epimerase (non-hydrolysing)
MNILVVFGTRPEAIKLFPIIHALKESPGFTVSVCVTAQHRQMLDQVLKITGIEPDVDLNLMKPNQSLSQLTSRILRGLDRTLATIRPNRVMVQGDTTTAMVAAISAFYHRIPVDHVEAGLRSGDNYSPFPEEVNRRIISSIASLHFAPTRRAADALLRENVPRRRVYVTGNSGIDALIKIKDRIADYAGVRDQIDDQLPKEGDNRRVILVTAHRRENFDGGMQRVASAIRMLAQRDDVVVVFPVHPNPNVLGPIRSLLEDQPRVRLVPPLDYLPFIYLLSRSDIVLTDSGGLQEEAPALGKPVLVMRTTTERPEGVEAGTALLVGTDPHRITGETMRLLDDRVHYSRMSFAHNPFGDGYASNRIVDILACESGMAPPAHSMEARSYAI